MQPCNHFQIVNFLIFVLFWSFLVNFHFLRFWRILSYDPSLLMALGRENRWNRFQVILAKIRPPFSPKNPFLDWKWPKIKIRLILSYDPSFFMFRARKNKKKIFLGPFDQIWPQIWAKKGHLGSKFPKNEKFSKHFFSIWMILSRKKAEKTMPDFLS